VDDAGRAARERVRLPGGSEERTDRTQGNGGCDGSNLFAAPFVITGTTGVPMACCHVSILRCSAQETRTLEQIQASHRRSGTPSDPSAAFREDEHELLVVAAAVQARREHPSAAAVAGPDG
jgi:hypothetical protein